MLIFILAPYLQVCSYPYIYLQEPWQTCLAVSRPHPSFLLHSCSIEIVGKLSKGGGDKAIVEYGRLWARDENIYFHFQQFAYSLLMLAVFLIIDLLVLPLSHTLGFSLLSPLYTKSSEKGPREEEKHSQSSVCVISAVDYNQLLFFVIANVLTGLVNMVVDTLHTGALQSLTILLLYMLVLVGMFVLLHTQRVKVKL